MILKQGEQIHVIHRRWLEKEPHRHFIGVVEEYQDGLARVTGHVYTVDRAQQTFVRREDKRTRIISLASGELLVNVIPAGVKLDKIIYRQEQKALRVTDGSGWHLDLSEVAWM